MTLAVGQQLRQFDERLGILVDTKNYIEHTYRVISILDRYTDAGNKTHYRLELEVVA